MPKVIFALLGVLSAVPLSMAHAGSADESNAFSVVKQFNTSFNNGDDAALAATCAPQAVVVDDLPPYVWRSGHACADWIADLRSFTKKVGLTDLTVTAGEPWQTIAAHDHAYTVFPADIAFKIKGKPSGTQGVWTFTLQKAAAGWLITSVTLGQH